MAAQTAQVAASAMDGRSAIKEFLLDGSDRRALCRDRRHMFCNVKRQDRNYRESVQIVPDSVFDVVSVCDRVEI